LRGRSYLMLQDYKKATETLERAASAEPRNSNVYLWLGRAYGHRAETAFAIAAPALAVKARQSFEKAVELDSGNWMAVDDLFEYYLEAPGFLGGGMDKAAKMADLVARHDESQAVFDRARISEKSKQFDTAEAQLRHAVKLAPHQVGHAVALARFLSKRGRYDESDRAFEQAAASNPNTPKLIYMQADTLIEANRKLQEARELLRKYLTMTLSPEDPSRQNAEALLRKVSGS
jgi:predicted Zn-dependent protease